MSTRAITFALMIGMITFHARVSSQPSSQGAPRNSQLAKLAMLEGSWVAKGDGFSSRLTYEWALPGVLLRSRNRLLNEAGQSIGEDEGLYAWDHGAFRIGFFTVGRDGELHRGGAEWRGRQLWHEATVSGGKTNGYRSVLEVVRNELHYRAKYELAASNTDVLSGTPLVYRRADP